MKNISFKSVAIMLIAVTLITLSCKKLDYYQDGGLAKQSAEELNMSAYDFLASRAPGKFDSLVKIIDLTNSKELINQSNITFYAVPNTGVQRFQSMFSNANKLIRPLANIGKDTLTFLLKRFVIPNSQVTLNQSIADVKRFYKDANNDSLFISFRDGGVKAGTTIQTSAFSMVYEHRKKPKVDSINFVTNSAFQTHDLRTKNAIIHVVPEGTNFSAGLKTKFYLN